jgi:lipid-A-disaccharide synthase
VKVLRQACDHVLCLLPFEAPFLAAAGVPSSFVGHPFADEIAEINDPAPVRAELGLSGGPVIALLPGSRMNEVARLGPVFAAAAALLRVRFPAGSFVAPMANPAVGEAFRAAWRAAVPGCEARLLEGRARDALTACDAALVASGTATLEAMLINRPMVVAYRLAPLTYTLGRALRIVQVPFFALPNLLAGEQVVPEYLQAEATPARLATSLGDLLEAPEASDALRRRFLALHRTLRRGASEAAAVAVLRVAGLAR